MARQPRNSIPNIPQHVIQRGADRQAVFFSAQDYELYLDTLRAAASQYERSIHAFVLMTNHTHFLITPGTKHSLPLLMQAMGRCYGQKLNQAYNRAFTLWQGRYKASLIHDDSYLLTCYRHIKLSPVRAGMVRLPGEYRQVGPLVDATSCLSITGYHHQNQFPFSELACSLGIET